MPSVPATSTTVTPPGPAPPPRIYDGPPPFPADGPAPARDGGERLYVAVTGVIVVLPFVAIGLAGRLLRGSLIHPVDIVLALVLYTVTGLGVTVGFHRGLTHGGYRAVRPVRIALAVADSMSFQGDVIGWVATHRRHHAFTDRPGDPHSPYRYGTHPRGRLRGLLHAHVGRLFRNDRTPADRYAPGLLADRDIRAVAWSVNSLCHLIGEGPFRTRRHDRAANLWPLALLSFGESRHNLHHADPTSARHGVDRGQIDPSAAFIRLLERLGWVHDVRRPTAERVAARRA
ncbi:acyl-CoA desaturase [Streptomyces sp. NPDC057002]|uniref:acyl-CoA desaturase n=1 Tax=Streptomyces sp. NPDC057002 TaxID=3345992 RepID=UPI003640D929